MVPKQVDNKEVSKSCNVRSSQCTESVWRHWLQQHGQLLERRRCEHNGRQLASSATLPDQHCQVHATKSTCDLSALWTATCSCDAALTPTDLRSVSLHHSTRAHPVGDSKCWRQRSQAMPHASDHSSSPTETASTCHLHSTAVSTREPTSTRLSNKQYNS